ncbi:MAG: hypothetical protein LBQ71_02435 [Hungatella sp.]|jgi:hypothetical protein|nr:hypothetical protein [Hungatella sp.]
MAIEYGTIAVVPKGEWDSDSQYEVANLVSRDGSSFLAHTRPQVGTLPTNTAYWQVSAQGTSKATDDSLGTVKPDGVTTEVSADGAMSAKTATQSTLGLVKGSAGINVGAGGTIDVNTIFTQAAELANIIAGEAISQVLGKISKSIAVTMGLDQNALLKNMLTNIDANDQNKIPTSAFVHTLYNRIGMGTELTAGANLTEAANTLNSDLNALLKVSYKDVVVDSKAYAAGEKYQVSIPVPDVSASNIICAKIIATTVSSHMVQFSIELGGGTMHYITNNYTGSLTDAITVRFYYWR